MTPIIKFYIERPVNDRTIRDIWQWDYENLEECHDYIQWLFPLDEPSKCVLDSPVLTPEDIEIFNSNILMKGRLFKSFMLMLDFYGYDVGESLLDGHILVGHSFQSDLGRWKRRLQHWATPNNHNYLRITRILRSMTLLGCPEYAKMFLKSLKSLWLGNKSCFDFQEYEEGCTLWYWEQACEV